MYNIYLKSRHWKETKDFLSYIKKKECYICGYKDNLNVHHLKYGNLNYEDGDDLIYLCRKCHFLFHFPCGKDLYPRKIDTEKEIIAGLKWLEKTMRKIRTRKKLPILDSNKDSVVKLRCRLLNLNLPLPKRKDKSWIEMAKDNYKKMVEESNRL